MRIRTLQLGSGGFTLIELLVVIAIIGFVVFILQGSRLQHSGILKLDHATRAVTDAIRSVRHGAMLDHREAMFAVDVEQRSFQPGQRTETFMLDPDIGLSLTAARQEHTRASVGGIRFFPDGSSTGGRMVLTLDGQERVIEVDWLTGMLTVTDRVR